jgi:hypothetical protein
MSLSAKHDQGGRGRAGRFAELAQLVNCERPWSTVARDVDPHTGPRSRTAGQILVVFPDVDTAIRG